MLRVSFDYCQLLKTTHVSIPRVLWVRVTDKKLIFEDTSENLYEYKLNKIKEVVIVTNYMQ